MPHGLAFTGARVMSTAWTITFDCADPAMLAAFWCRALGYVEGTPPGDWPGRARP